MEPSLHDLLRKVMDKEPLSREEACRVWREMHAVVEAVEDGGVLLCLHDHMTRELVKGERCGVCGRYEDEQCWANC